MKSTNWTTATTSVSKAMVGLVSCLQYGYDAWLEVQENGKQDHPLTIKNPALDDFRNWKSTYGVPRNDKELADHKWFNDTAKFVTMGCVHVFGDREAVERYYAEGILSADNFRSGGVSHIVKIEDYNKFMQGHDPERVVGDKGTSWIWHAEPKDDIPRYIPDPDVKHVIVVCYDTDKARTMSEGDALRKAGTFLLNIGSLANGGGLKL